jgi:hypothetical protein
MWTPRQPASIIGSTAISPLACGTPLAITRSQLGHGVAESI